MRDLIHQLQKGADSAAEGRSWSSAPWHDDLRRLVERLEEANGSGRAYASGRGSSNHDLHSLIRQLEGAVRGGNGGRSHREHHAFWFGAAAGAALVAAAPYLGSKLRPVLRQAIKGSILVGRQLQEATAAAREDLEDLTSEAKAELETKGGGGGNGSEGGGAGSI